MKHARCRFSPPPRAASETRPTRWSPRISTSRMSSDCAGWIRTPLDGHALGEQETTTSPDSSRQAHPHRIERHACAAGFPSRVTDSITQREPSRAEIQPRSSRATGVGPAHAEQMATADPAEDHGEQHRHQNEQTAESRARHSSRHRSESPAANTTKSLRAVLERAAGRCAVVAHLDRTHGRWIQIPAPVV